MPRLRKISSSCRLAAARLIEQGERLKTLAAQSSCRKQRTNGQIRLAFVADQQYRRLARRNDQQRFFESRIETRQVGQIRKVLAISINHQMREPPRLHRAPGGIDPRLKLLQRGGRRPLAAAKFRPCHFEQLVLP